MQSLIEVLKITKETDDSYVVEANGVVQEKVSDVQFGFDHEMNRFYAQLYTMPKSLRPQTIRFYPKEFHYVEL